MNLRHQAIRSLLSTMAPKRAIAYVKDFGLREDEEAVIIQHEVYGLSIRRIAENLNMAEESVKNKRKMAFTKMVDAIEHEDTHSD